jgi:hypothetical protein
VLLAAETEINSDYKRKCGVAREAGTIAHFRLPIANFEVEALFKLAIEDRQSKMELDSGMRLRIGV